MTGWIVRQPGSGSGSRKGDIYVGQKYIVECKATEQKGFRITTDLMAKAMKDAAAHARIPLVAVRLADGKTYWVVEDPIMLNMLEMDESYDELLGTDIDE